MVALIEAELRTAVSPQTGTLPAPDREAICRRLGEGTGARALADLIDATYRRRASAVTGWPIRHGILALRSRSQGVAGRYHPWTAPVAAGPAAPPIQRTDVQSAVDDAIGIAAEGLPPLWRNELRKIGDSFVRDLTDTLDATLSGTEVGSRLVPRWWTAVQVLHWMLLTAALIGLSGVVASALFGGTSSLNMPNTPIPFPALLLMTALAAGPRWTSLAGSRRHGPPSRCGNAWPLG